MAGLFKERFVHPPTLQMASAPAEDWTLAGGCIVL